MIVVMKVLYDYQILVSQRFGGISRYFYEIISRMSNNEEFNYFIPIKLSRNYYFQNVLGKSSFKKYIPKTAKFIISLNKILTKKHIAKKHYDIYHPTYYDPYLLDNLVDAKLVVTVHDLIQEIYPNIYKDDIVLKHKKDIISRADRIIAVSQNTRDDIIKFYPEINPNKITVIYHGSSLPKVEFKLVKDFNMPKKYVLFVGLRSGYKNFHIFYLAMRRLMKHYPDLYLICVGGGVFNKTEYVWFRDDGVEDRVIQNSYSDIQLSYLYQNAICFVFPSCYEGFGIPVLEAFENQCPCVISGSSSLPEVGGNAALYVDDQSDIDIENKIEELILNEQLRKELIELGKLRLKNFSWEKASKETFDLYNSLLK